MYFQPIIPHELPPRNPQQQTTIQNDPRYDTTPSGVIRPSSQSTLDKILAASLQSIALLRGAQYIPTEEVPQGLYNQQPQYYPQNQQLQNPYIPVSESTGATFGASVEAFLRNNTALIAVGVVGYMLFMSGRK